MSKNTRIKRKRAGTTGFPSTKQRGTLPTIEKATKTWKFLITGFTLFSAGFTAGIYVSNTNSKIEFQDKINEYREKIIEIEKQHEKDIHDYNHEISILADENNDLKQQIRQLNTKKK